MSHIGSFVYVSCSPLLCADTRACMCTAVHTCMGGYRSPVRIVQGHRDIQDAGAWAALVLVGAMLEPYCVYHRCVLAVWQGGAAPRNYCCVVWLLGCVCCGTCIVLRNSLHKVHQKRCCAATMVCKRAWERHTVMLRVVCCVMHASDTQAACRLSC